MLYENERNGMKNNGRVNHSAILKIFLRLHFRLHRSVSALRCKLRQRMIFYVPIDSVVYIYQTLKNILKTKTDIE